MSSENRLVVVKNNDPNITYTGEWTSVQANTVINFGTIKFGSALSPMLHTISSNGGFSFQFHGSSWIEVFGSINITNSSSTGPNPTWTCSVDGSSLGIPNLSDDVENNWSLCSNHALLLGDGHHELIMNVTSDGTPFYVDYIKYRASPHVSLENTLISIDNPDPAIEYGSGWGSLGGIANQTTDPNPEGSVNVTFVGIQLFWYGLIPTEESHKASSGEYSIDGGPFSAFPLDGLPSAAAATAYNQLFFNTSILDMGTHVLSVKYTGIPGETPLTLDYLYVMNGSFPSVPEAKPPASNPMPSDDSSPSKDKGSANVGAIVGVVVSIVGVAMIIFLIWFKIYRKRHRGPYETVPRPTPSPPLQINQIPNNPTQHTSTGSSTVIPAVCLNSDLISPIPLYTHDPAAPQTHDSPPPAMTSVPSGNRLSLPVTPVHTSNTISRESRIIRHHEDSGLRLRLPAAVEEVEVPPIYTEN